VGTSGVGGLALSAPSSIEFLLSGTAPGQFDSLQVDGAAALAGTLVVELASAFTPMAGDTFEILRATSGRTGMFDSLALPSLVGGLSWNLAYGAQNVVLSVGNGSLPGDFNGDGNYDCGDVDSLVQDIASGINTSSFDLTGDGLVNGSDLTEWLTIAGATNLPSGNAYLIGDANLDGTVDGQDFIAWNNSKFTSIAAWCSGDFNADGAVDGQDFIAWNANKFQSADGLGSSAVPEPTGLALAALALGLIVARRSHTT
jgi:hypothetical protein